MFSDSALPHPYIPNPQFYKLSPIGDLRYPIGNNMPNWGYCLLVLYYSGTENNKSWWTFRIFPRFSDFSTFSFYIFHFFGIFLGLFRIFGFFWIFEILYFFCIFWIFSKLLGFLLIVTEVNPEHQTWPKVSQKSLKKCFFLFEGQKKPWPSAGARSKARVAGCSF